MRKRQIMHLRVDGSESIAIDVTDALRRVKKCRENLRGEEYCWEEHYISVYVPTELLPQEGERLLLVKVCGGPR